MKKEMLINVLQPEECRIAIVEDGVLEELYVERTSHESYVGNIYKGRIVNIEPSIQAAFVDFGVGRNGFLHVSDVEPAYYRHLERDAAARGARRPRRAATGRAVDDDDGRRRRAAQEEDRPRAATAPPRANARGGRPRTGAPPRRETVDRRGRRRTEPGRSASRRGLVRRCAARGAPSEELPPQPKANGEPRRGPPARVRGAGRAPAARRGHVAGGRQRSEAAGSERDSEPTNPGEGAAAKSIG